MFFMRVIGIDPGTLCCGYGVIETGARVQGFKGSKNPDPELAYVTSGEIRMKNTESLPERLKILYTALKNIIDEYTPAHLCIEKIFYHKSIHSAFALGTARGIVMLLAAQNAIPVFEYNSTALKMALTGYGRAEKRQVKEMVIRILNLKNKQDSRIQEFKGSSRNKNLISSIDPSAPRPLDPLIITEDAADALALCICHINHYSSGFKEGLK
ncbi:MAG: crossover junction endodeoxyribonuclease RuvC [Nitrospirae bacterium]|nr:crossover junction endodeoxyribonuclease RuvC [Nitrospirota bacterium]